MYERAELSRGTYEIVATKEYMVRAAQPVIHVFCIDVSAPAIASGATAATCQCIEQVLDSIQGEWAAGGMNISTVPGSCSSTITPREVRTASTHTDLPFIAEYA